MSIKKVQHFAGLFLFSPKVRKLKVLLIPLFPFEG